MQIPEVVDDLQDEGSLERSSDKLDKRLVPGFSDLREMQVTASHDMLQAGLESAAAISMVIDTSCYPYREALFGEADGFYPHKPRKGVTRKAMSQYLENLARTSSFSMSAAGTGVSPPLWRDLRRTDPDFGLYCQYAIQIHGDAVYRAAHTMAFQGVPEAIFHEGLVIGFKNVRNVGLADRILRGFGARFRDNPASAVDGPGEGGTSGGVLVVGGMMDTEDWEEEHAPEE